MHVRCPHCHQPVELVDNAGLEHIDCPSCGSHFSLLGDQTASHHAGEVRTIGHFELIERLGMGQFGTVWMARDTELDRTVAVKIPRQEQLSRDDVEMFLREARAAAQLHHPNIVSVHEVGREGDTVYIVSDLVRGVTLADRLTAGRLSPREAAQLCVTIAEALHHAHQAGVIHRDLKPSNIMLDAEGQPHLMDFGLAKREAAEITMTLDGRILGTPAYMSPEQARGEAHHADARSDIYSLGTILFELLTGELPFRGNARMLTMQIIHDEPPSPRKLDAAVPRDLETICLKCLEKSPERRYATAHDVADELRRYLDGQPIHARPVGWIERSWRCCKRNPAVAALAASVILVLIGGAGVSAYFAVEERVAKLDAQRAAQRERDQAIAANSERDRADREAAAAVAARQITEHAAQAEKAQRLEAERQSRISTVLRLAAESQAVRAEKPVQSILLAVEAARLGNGADTASRRAARQALRDNFGGNSFLRLEFTFGPRLAISPDGRWLATSAEDVRLWDLTSADPTARPRVLGGQPESSFLAFTGDGRWLASGGPFRQFHLWDMRSNNPAANVLKLQTPQRGWAAPAVSGDGRWLAAGTGELAFVGGVASVVGRVYLWNLTARAAESAPTLLEGHHAAVWSLAISADGHWLASSSRDGSTRLWDLSADSPAGSSIALSEGDKHPGNVVISPDGHWLAMGGPRPRLYDLTAIHADVNPHVLPPVVENSLIRNLYKPMVFSPDSHWLVTAGEENTLRVWDLSAKIPEESWLTLSGHAGPVYALTASADGRWLVSGSLDKSARVWDLSAANPNALPKVLRGHLAAVTEVAISPDRRWLATSCGLLAGTSDTTVRLWDLSQDEAHDRTTLRGHTKKVHSAAISADGHWLATASADATARLWDLKAANPNAASIELCGHKRDVLRLAFTPDARRLITTSEDKTVRVWNLDQGAPTEHCQVLQGHTGTIWRLAISSDGQWLATGGSDETPRLWNLKMDDPAASPIVLRHPPNNAGHVRDLAFSPDNRWLATGDYGRTARLWDMRASDPAANPIVLEEAAGVAFSTNGRWFAAGNRIAPHDGDLFPTDAIGLWDLNAPSAHVKVLAPEGRYVIPIACAARGRWQVGALVDNMVCLWSLADAEGSTDVTVLPHQSRVLSAIMSADGRWLVTQSSHSPIRLWELREPDPAGSAILLREAGVPLALAPDGRWLVTRAEPEREGTLCLWRLNPEELVRLARAMAGRELTEEERRQFLVPEVSDD